MELVSGRRAAEDDEHTEVRTSITKPQLYLHDLTFLRLMVPILMPKNQSTFSELEKPGSVKSSAGSSPKLSANQTVQQHMTAEEEHGTTL